MAPPRTYAAGPGTLQRRLIQASADGDLRAFKRIATALDGGKGRIREAVEAVRDRGVRALHVAAGRGRIPVCAYMVEELHMDVNAADESGNTPLSHAVRAGNVGIVRYLLDHGADPNKPVDFECTSIHIAVGKGMCEMVELLLSKGADVNFSSHCGAPLHIAAMENQDAAMKVLLDHGADINKTHEALNCFSSLFTQEWLVVFDRQHASIMQTIVTI
ncbi:ankyrin-like protein-like protein [Panicum miliaceum]|uniref:Ankyrin-like protein-like protein n=1 Tax=Panicum miliaceum TaxID=4540 RepID=A0A3L6RWZ4_PANMI|nr:ankyrin-like protein-like protein [Panicum miliaceum]